MEKKTSKLKEMQEVFRKNNITTETIELNDELIYEVKDIAKTIQDYRHESYKRHKLVDVVMITFFALLANANEWSDIEVFAKEKETWLRKYLELPYGIPTDDTIRLIISNIDSKRFYEVTIQFLIRVINEMLNAAGVEEEAFEADVIAVDGKESRGSKRGKTDKEAVEALQTLNVYSTSYHMCIAQEFIEEKSNEIPAAQAILKIMDLNGDVVTSDATNCQIDTVKAIVLGGGEYVLALKGNQKNFHLEVKQYFEEDVLIELKGKENCYKKTTEKEHGGIAIREYYISADVKWFADYEKWQKLNAFGMVKKTLKKKTGEIITEYRYYICSIGEDVTLFERSARGHWRVENNLHWHLDFVFKDDKNNSMAKTGAKNMQLMKKIVLAILGIVKNSYKLSMTKIRYKLSLNFEDGIEKMLSLLSLQSIHKALQK